MKFCYIHLVALIFLICRHVTSEIRGNVILNILTKAKPAQGDVGNRFAPLTEIPRPREPHGHTHGSGRRHFEGDCSDRPPAHEVFEGGKVQMMGDYYDEKVAKTVATVIIPDHIDYKHYQVTTQVPYLTLGPIEAMGHHPSTLKSEHPRECEKIYQDHIQDMYSDDVTDYSEESLEMAKMPISPIDTVKKDLEEHLDNMYADAK